jgi:hypothetical protein
VPRGGVLPTVNPLSIHYLSRERRRRGECRAAQSKPLDHPEQFAKSDRGFRGTGAVYEMDPLSFRFRYFLAILFAAVVTAAALRHFAHVNGGLAREEIRTDALIAAALIGVLLIIIFVRRKRQR